MIIHLEKEQLKQARRDLLSDDVYIIFVDALRQYHQEGYTTLAPAFGKILCGRRFAVAGYHRGYC